MKNLLYLIFIVLFFTTCKKGIKKETTTLNELHLSGIKAASGSPELINLNLNSGKISSTNIDCFVFGSTVYDAKNEAFGYVDCNAYYVLRNVTTNEILKTLQLPGYLSQVVSDPVENTIIGQAYANDSNFITKVDIGNGTLVARNYIRYPSNSILACFSAYRQKEKDYLLLASDSSLLFISPNTGEILKTTKIGVQLSGCLLDDENNRLIGFNYSNTSQKNNIITVDIETGNTLSEVEVKDDNNYLGCVFSYDKETNSFIMLSYPQNKLLFIDINSGELNKSYQLDFQVTDLKFWRK